MSKEYSKMSSKITPKPLSKAMNNEDNAFGDNLWCEMCHVQRNKCRYFHWNGTWRPWPMDTSFLVLLNFYFVFITNFFQTSSSDILLSTTNWHLPGAFASVWTTTARAFASCLCCCSCWLLTPSEGTSGWRVKHSVFQGNWLSRSLDS